MQLINGGKFLLFFMDRFLCLVKRSGEKAEIKEVKELNLGFFRNNKGHFTFALF